MTTRDHARPLGRDRGRGLPPDDGHRPGPLEPRPPIGERLRTAREAKGVDLLRAERETKIRRHYLDALERGEYAALPASVYTKGFLRNYALYLGLDADDILAQWHSERGEAASGPVMVGPQPLEAPGRGFVFTPGLVVGAVLALAVVAFAVYLGLQLLRFSEPPTITVTDPPGALTEVAEMATTYAMGGTTVKAGIVTIRAPGRDDLQVTAGTDGVWRATVELRRGRNQFEISAVDPATGKVTEAPVTRVITVPTSPIVAPTLAVDSPAEGATYENGAIPVSGKAANATEISIGAAYVGPAPGQAASASPPPAPTPVTVGVGDDGSFSTSLDLTAGAWTLTMTAKGDEGKTTILNRAVTVVYKGINLVVEIKGDRTWLRVSIDGIISTETGVGGKVYAAGKTVTFTAQSVIELRTGKASTTFVTVNGTSYGALGPTANPGTWRIQQGKPPSQVRGN